MLIRDLAIKLTNVKQRDGEGITGGGGIAGYQIQTKGVTR